jgi:L-alanine-DL-glutamate epimerase-like enolase superfamily enzyme
MRIVDIREVTVPIEADMSNAFINFSTMNVSLLAIVTDVMRGGSPVVGFGFNSNGRYAQGALLRERIIPRVLAAAPESLLDPGTGRLDPGRIWAAAMRDEKPGGHGERAVAMGVLDMAAWDAAAKLAEQPLYVHIAERLGPGSPAQSRVWVYAAGGYYYPDRGIEAIRQEMLGYLDRGFRTVKMKIGGAPLSEDLRRIEAVLEVLPEGCTLAVDANGRFEIDEALDYAKALADYDLQWYEEPVDPLDYRATAEVARAYPGRLATGENLMSWQDARNLLRYGGLRPDLDVLQMDPALSYGLTEYRKFLTTLDSEGWSPARCVPHGGHQFNLAIAAALGLGGIESYPGIFAPFGGLADAQDQVDDGYVTMIDAPGIGLEEKSSLTPLLRDLATS